MGDFVEDGLDGGMRDKRFGVRVGHLPVFLDGSDELRDALETPSADSFLRQLPEPALHQVSHKELVGVKCTWKRGCLLSHARTFAWECVP